jgi:superfamily II DNA or RNA helicase
VCEAFLAAGYKFEHVDGTLSKDARTKVFDRLKNGEIHGITSVNLVTEGFDAPILQCAISLRPTRNVGLYIQMISRVLRPYEGQDCAYHLDHAGLTRRHDEITKRREWSLANESKRDKKEREDREAAGRELRQCPECFALHTYAPKCVNPKCGHVYEVKSREIEVVDGELKLFEPVVADDIDTCDEMFDQLKQIGKDKGYAESWAINIWADWQKKLNN